MKKRRARRFGYAAIRLPRLLGRLLIIALCCLLVRAFAASKPLDRREMTQALTSEAVVSDILKLSLGSAVPEDPAGSLFSLLSRSAFGSGETGEEQAAEGEKKALSGTLFYEHPAGAEDGGAKPDAPASGGYIRADYPRDAGLVSIKNNPGADIDPAGLLSEKLNIKLGEGPSVLIVHTHASEAYTPAGADTYVESDPYRTEDITKSVVAVGTLLADALTERGVSVIHDTGIYDYPSYAGSYTRTYDVITGYLEKYPSIGLVIDLHRDASEAGEALEYKTVMEAGGLTASQLMFVVGTNSSGLEHPNWRENLKLAMNFQCAAESRYPGLCRPISISKYRYNQQATSGSLILEVGYCGNTLEEAKNAALLFSDAAADVLLPLTEA